MTLDDISDDPYMTRVRNRVESTRLTFNHATSKRELRPLTAEIFQEAQDFAHEEMLNEIHCMLRHLCGIRKED